MTSCASSSTAMTWRKFCMCIFAYIDGVFPLLVSYKDASLRCRLFCFVELRRHYPYRNVSHGCQLMAPRPSHSRGPG